MSQLETPGPPDAILRNRPVPIPRPGVTESLAAPGVVPLPYHLDKGAQMADQFLRAVSYTGQLASDVAIEQRRAQIRQEEVDRLAKSAHEGQAAEDFGTAIPSIQAQIENRSLIVPDGITPEEFAAEYVNQKIQGQPAAYQDRFRKLAVPALTRSLYAQRKAVEEQARDEDLALRAQKVAVLTDPAEINATIDEAKKLYPDLSDTKLRAALVVPALNAAARAGNIGVYTAAGAALGPADAFKIERDHAAALLEESNVRRAALAHKTAIDGFALLQEKAAGVDALRAYVDSHAEIDPNTRIELRSRLRAAEDEQLKTTQRAGSNALAADIFLGRWEQGTDGQPDPVATASGIAERMLRPPADPRHIDADRGRQLIEFIDKSLKTDTRAALVDHVLASPDSGVVLTDADSSAIMVSLGRRGIVQGQQIGEGRFALQGVADPLQLAVATDRIRIVPNDVQDWIRNGAASADPGQAAQALGAYAAIYAANPRLAASIRLAPDVAARARYVVSRLENGDPSWKQSNEALSAAVAPLTRTAVKIDPNIAAIDDAGVLGTVLFGNPNRKSEAGPGWEQSVSDKITKAVRERVKSEIGDKPAVVPAQLAEEYRRNLIDEYKVQRSLTTDDAKAAEAASAWAMRKTVADNPPSSWGGTVRFQRKGQPSMPEDVAKVLRDEVEKSIDSDTAKSLWSRYFPVYTTQTKSGKPGFMFLPTDGSQTPFTVGGGAALVVSMPEPKTERVMSADTRLNRLNAAVMSNPALREIVTRNRGLVHPLPWMNPQP